MKTFTKRRIIIDFFILFGIVAVALVLFPLLSKVIVYHTSTARSVFFQNVKDSLGLDISYKELSPSLISKINLHSVTIQDEKGVKLAYFDHILIEYKLFEILFGHYDNAIKNIVIRDGEFFYNSENQSYFFTQLFSATETDKTQTLQFDTRATETSEQNENTSTNTHLFNIPLKKYSVNLHNIFISYSDETYSGTLTLFSGKLQADGEKLQFDILANISATQQSPSMIQADADFKISGNGKTDFSLISAVLQVSSFSVNKARIADLSFFVSLSEQQLSLLAFQKADDFNIKASYDLASKTGSASLTCNYFKVNSFVYLDKNRDSIIHDLVVNGFASIDFNLQEKLQLEWETDIEGTVPLIIANTIQSKNNRFKIVANGTHERAEVKNAQILSDILNLQAFGKYDFVSNTVSAQAYLHSFRFNNKNIKTKMSIYNGGRSYICTINDTYIGDAVFPKAQLTLIPRNNNFDATFVIDDEFGAYSFDASYVNSNARSQFLEVHGVLDSVSVQKIYDAISVFAPSVYLPFLHSQLEPFRITSEVYVTSDLSSFSYNVVQLILASTEAGGLYALSSFDGSNASFNLSNLSINIDKTQINGTVNASFGLGNDIFFDSMFSVGAISYTANGIISNGQLNLYGDYGFLANVSFVNSSIQGTVETKEFPVPILPFVLSFNSHFNFTNLTNWNFVCEQLTLSYSKDFITDTYLNSPFTLNLKAEANPQTIFISEISMGNDTNLLTGQASLDIIADKIASYTQYSLTTELSDAAKTQTFTLDANVSIGDEVLLDGNCNINNISLSLFSPTQAPDDIVNGSISFLGSLDNMRLQLNLEKLKMHVANKPLEASIIFLLDDKLVSIPQAHIVWDTHSIDSLIATFNPDTSIGNLGINYSGTIAGKSAMADVELHIEGQQENLDENNTLIQKFTNVLDSFVLTSTVKKAQLGEMKLGQPFELSVMRENDVLAIYDKDDTINGFYLNDGTVSLNMSDELKTHISCDGSITSSDIMLQCYNISLDVPQFLNFLPIDNFFTCKTGTLNGELLIEGKLNEPQFFGTLYLDNASFYSPDYAPDLIEATNVPIIFSEYTLEVPEVALNAKKFTIVAECTSEFEGWIPAETIVKCSIDENRLGHIKTKNLLFHADGGAACDLVMTITLSSFDLQGTAVFDEGSFSIAFDTFDDFIEMTSPKPGSSFSYTFTMDLNVILGKKAEYNWPNMKTPVLTTLIPTEEPIVFHVTPTSFTITGLANMRGGEITYIKRNFYIKEGNIKFVETIDGFSPLINVRAEIRDRDIDGKQFKLILNLEDQPLIGNTDAWISKITSDPAKSENEIMQLLGQLVVADMTRSTLIQDTLTNATDLVTQLMVTKNIENAIRDFLHLDVLSLRTQILQNVVFGNLFRKANQNELTIGNYLDNTSFYFGKYFGSAIYADAALHLSYDDPLRNTPKKTAYNGILFEPELGLEMSTPFANIRWAISPTNLDSLFVDNTSITFSWSFSY